MSTHPVTQNVIQKQCINIKSKRYPDVGCKSIATHGDFCMRHHKNPIRYTKDKTAFRNISYNPVQEGAARKIQRAARLMLSKKNYKRQGPACNILTLSENKTELHTMEELDTIPKLYIWSYADEKKHIWTFDIRAFSHMMSLKNPYTQLHITDAGKRP